MSMRTGEGGARRSPGLVRIELAALFAALVVLALASAPHSVQPGDAGEISTVILRGGVAHPPGYPLLRLLGLPARALEAAGVTPARAAALPCALAGAASFALLGAWLVRHARLPLVSLAVLLCAAAPVCLRHLYDAEVWGLHLLLCSALVVALLAQRSSPLLAVGFGLATAQHLTASVLLPWLAAVVLERALREARSGAGWPRALARVGALAALSAAVALTAYASLRLAGPGAWAWGDLSTWEGWWHHVLRSEYGTFELSRGGTAPDATAQLWRQAVSLGGIVGGSGPAAGALGALLLAAAWLGASRLAPAPSAWSVWGQRASLLCAGPLFCLAGNVDPVSPFGAWFLERFDLLVVLLLLPGLAGCLELAAGRLRGAARALLPATLLAVAAFVLADRSRWMQTPAADLAIESHAHDVLQTPEPGRLAIVVGGEDHRTFPILFLQRVASLRADDVVYLDAQLMAQGWYRAWLERTTPEPLPRAARPLELFRALWSQPGGARPPVYLTHAFSPAAARLRVVPEGLLLRAIPPGADPAEWTPERLAERHLAALARYRGRAEHFAVAPGERASHPWGPDLWEPYLRSTRELARLLAARGREDLAASMTADAQRILSGG